MAHHNDNENGHGNGRKEEDEEGEEAVTTHIQCDAPGCGNFSS